MFDGLAVALLNQFLTDLVGQASDLAFADADARHSDGVGGLAERGEAGNSGDDALDDRGTVAVLIAPQGSPWGGKVPAAVGTVGEAFGLLDLGPLGGQGPAVRLGGTELAAGGTGLFVGELVGLLLQQQLQGSFSESLGATVAICSKVRKSTSRPGPSSPKARRDTFLPHWAARALSWLSSSAVNRGVDMARPALKLWR